MTKKLLLLAILAGTITLGGCLEKGPDPEVELLKDKLEAIEAEKAKAEAEAKAEADRIERENAIKEEEAKLKAEEAKAAADKAEKDKLKKEIDDLKKKANALPKFGPGNGNNLQGYSDGYVKIHTRSANGKLTLRSSPTQSGTKITTIANGTDGIYYFYREKHGEYVWYQVDYFGQVGWLRGDYLHRY